MALLDFVAGIVKSAVSLVSVTATFTVKGAPTHNADGSVTYASSTTNTATVSIPLAHKRALMSGEIIKTDELDIIVPAQDLGFEPTQNMEVAVVGQTFTITKIAKQFLSADVVSHYTVTLKN